MNELISVENEGSGTLFHDIHAADSVIARPTAVGEIAAVERGTREFPDGRVDRYERIEYREDSSA